MFPVMVLRWTGEFNGGVLSAFYLLPMTICCFLTAFNMVKAELYTGYRSGFEHKDEKGSPYMGRLVGKHGFLRIENFLVILVFLILMYAVSNIYVYVIQNEVSDSNGKATISSVMFMLSTFIIAIEGFSVLAHRWRVFFKKMWLALKEHVPVFFAFQILFTLISAILYLIIALLSGTAAESGEVAESLMQRVLGEAFETTSVGGFLVGKSSVLSSLTASSMYVSLIDGVIDLYYRADRESGKSYREQFSDMAHDPANIRVLVLLVTCLIYTGITQVLHVGKLLAAVIRLIILLIWLYNGFKFLTSLRLARYILVTFSIVYVDQLIVMPTITDRRSAILALGIFVLRTLLFVIIGIMVASLLNLTETGAAVDFSFDDISDDVTEGKGFIRQAFDSMKEPSTGRDGTQNKQNIQKS